MWFISSCINSTTGTFWTGGKWRLDRGCRPKKTGETVDRRQKNGSVIAVSPRHCLATTALRSCCVNCRAWAESQRQYPLHCCWGDLINSVLDLFVCLYGFATVWHGAHLLQTRGACKSDEKDNQLQSKENEESTRLFRFCFGFLHSLDETFIEKVG